MRRFPPQSRLCVQQKTKYCVGGDAIAVRCGGVGSVVQNDFGVCVRVWLRRVRQLNPLFPQSSTSGRDASLSASKSPVCVQHNTSNCLSGDAVAVRCGGVGNVVHSGRRRG